MSTTSATTKTRKLRWELTAFPTGFAELRYPKDLNYLMTIKNMMGHRNPSPGYQTTYKLSIYSWDLRQQQCKAYNYT
jgi:hypothetical protein